jgi:hypothetical protein
LLLLSPLVVAHQVCLSFKMQGPGALQYYGLFWDEAEDRHEEVLNYYIVSELCAGTLRDALYVTHPGFRKRNFKEQILGESCAFLRGKQKCVGNVE